MNKYINYLLLIIQIILSITFTTTISKILPDQLLYVLIAVMIVLNIITLLLMKKKKIINSILSILLIILFTFATYSINKIYTTLNQISNNEYATHLFEILVLDESNHQSIDDLNSKLIGKENTLANSSDLLLKHLESLDLNLQYMDYTNTSKMYLALINGDIEAMILNESYKNILAEIYPNFNDQVRVLYQYEAKEIIEETTNQKETIDDTFTIYISGIDTYGPINTVSRSDVNMLMTVNTHTKQILLNSIPRDYYVTLASFNAKDKLTHSGLYGINETVLTIEKLMDIDIDYYARINFTSLVELVDLIGGIDVYSDQEFIAYNNKSLTIPKGMVHMDGLMALHFARERYAYSTGDTHRNQNQRDVLAAIIKKTVSPAVLKNYNALLTTATTMVNTNIPTDMILDLIKLQIDENISWDIKQNQIYGTGSTSTTCFSLSGLALYVSIPEPTSLKHASDLIHAMENNDQI